MSEKISTQGLLSQFHITKKQVRAAISCKKDYLNDTKSIKDTISSAEYRNWCDPNLISTGAQ